MKISPIPILKDNYVWVIQNSSQQAIIIDPGEATPVLEYLDENSLHLSAILITHHHWDHTDGIKGITERYDVPVYGVTHPVKEGDQLKIDSFLFDVIEIPGHTLDHVAYHLKSQQALFTGDTLFCAGCGRIFEGSVQQMYSSLEKITALSDDTRIYCGHEYTVNNLRFAECVDPLNKDIKQRIIKVETQRKDNIPTVPSLLSEEKKTNPFLRCNLPAIQASVEEYSKIKLNTPLEIFEYLRKWKDVFR